MSKFRTKPSKDFALLAAISYFRCPDTYSSLLRTRSLKDKKRLAKTKQNKTRTQRKQSGELAKSQSPSRNRGIYLIHTSSHVMKETLQTKKHLISHLKES